MIEINYNKEQKNLNESKAIKSLINDLNNREFPDFNINPYKQFHACDSALSFSKIFQASSLIKTSITYLVLTSPKTKANLDADILALRKYDSSFPSDYKINGNKVITISSDLIRESEAYIVGLENDDFLSETLEINIYKLKLKISKDLSKIPIIMKDFIKIINIVNYH